MEATPIGVATWKSRGGGCAGTSRGLSSGAYFVSRSSMNASHSFLGSESTEAANIMVLAIDRDTSRRMPFASNLQILGWQLPSPNPPLHEFLPCYNTYEPFGGKCKLLLINA